MPLSALFPDPPTVRRKPPLVTPLTTVRALAELLVQDWAAPSVTATFCKFVPDPIVTAPAPLSTAMPEVPSVRVWLAAPPPSSAVVPALVPRKLRPRTDWAALRLTVCAVLVRVLMLKMATSPVVGTAAGSGVVAPKAVDQLAVAAHEVPDPSQ